jgi:lipopolysaccharide export LptBFGC system permease protein LptF
VENAASGVDEAVSAGLTGVSVVSMILSFLLSSVTLHATTAGKCSWFCPPMRRNEEKKEKQTKYRDSNFSISNYSFLFSLVPAHWP